MRVERSGPGLSHRLPTRRQWLAKNGIVLASSFALTSYSTAQQPPPRRRSRERVVEQGRNNNPVAADQNDSRSVWYPFPAGVVALCSQGPLGTGTHASGYSWDFSLDEGTPLLAPADGRVLWVTDHHRVEGIRPRDNSAEAIREYQRISMAQSNNLAVDHGDGTYSWYWHHRGGSARVRPGDFVSAGTMMAEVGKSGTYAPHICFTLFAPDRPNGCPVRFRGRRGGAESAATGDRCISATPPPRRGGNGVRDSILRGGEFAANGVQLDPGPPLFRLPVGEAIELAGRVTEPATLVGFYIWPEGKTSEHIQTVAPSGDGQFRIEARIPELCRGLRYWTVAITQPNGQVKFPSSTRVVVG